MCPSTVSDYEPAAGLQRAMSCDSVASDSSILDVEPDAPKIGQLEFGLEYDRLVLLRRNQKFVNRLQVLRD